MYFDQGASQCAQVCGVATAARVRKPQEEDRVEL